MKFAVSATLETTSGATSVSAMVDDLHVMNADQTEWRIDVTDADVRAAKRAWLAARRADPASARTAELYRSYERIVRTQARQLMERVRSEWERDRSR